MRPALCEELAPESMNEPVSTGQLRLWAAPRLIMVATNLTDELTILPHAIVQARQSGAKVLLVHVIDNRRIAAARPNSFFHRLPDSHDAARSALDRMAQQLRWVGIVCDPVILTGISEVEIPRYAKAFKADRLLVAFADNPDLTTSRSATLVERILPAMGIPVCVIGRHVSLSSPRGLKAKNVTLAVSLNSDCQVHLGFASRLVQEAHGTLTVLHVYGSTHSQPEEPARSLAEVETRLPFQAFREAELFSPTEINLRQGDPAEEILRHNSSGKEGLIVLCSSGTCSPGQTWRDSVSRRVLAEARYPVFILEKHVSAPANVILQEKLPARSASLVSDAEKDKEKAVLGCR